MTNYQSTFARAQFAHVLKELGLMIDSLTAETLHYQAGGNTNSIASILGHVVFSADLVFTGLLQKETPLIYSTNSGLSSLPPAEQAMFDWGEWGKSVTLEIEPFKAYYEAVFASVDNYLSNLTDDEFDLEAEGSDGRTIGGMIIIILANTTYHVGEIASIKGLQNEKGFSM